MKPSARRQPLPYVVLLLILLLAFALRLHALDAQSLWYDEAVTAQVASRGIAELTRWTADDIQPPLYYYVVAGWTRLAGRSEWALRFPSVFFGVLTVALLWATARRLFERSGHAGRGATGDENVAQSAGLRVRGQTQSSGLRHRAIFRADAHAGRGATGDENAAEHPERSGAESKGRSGRPGQAASFDWSLLVKRPDLQTRSGCSLIFRAASGHLGAGLAALLAAILPLYVYYAQEARMYTLLTFLGLLAGYALLRAMDRGQGSGIRSQRAGDPPGLRVKPANPKGGRRTASSPEDRPQGQTWWWITFVLASAAMLYTHYFGVFLLIAYAFCFLAASLLRFRSSAFVRARPRPILSFGVSTLAIILLYLPWLPAMLNRYRADASYWQGTLKLDEALRHVALSFTVAAPEMMLEPEGIRLLPFFGVALLMAIVSLIWQRRAGVTLTLLTVLFVPLFAVLLLASRTPKFNPRYLMLASPAYLLLLAGGIAVLVTRRSPGASGSGVEAVRRPSLALAGLPGPRGQPEASMPNVSSGGAIMPRAARSTLALLMAAFLVLASFLSIRNWFTDPAFTKAQWRELAAFVRQARAPDEAVLLVSGHAYPAWDYYAADIPATRLPRIDILDVNAVLGFEAGTDLAAALAGKAGAWLVGWQDEVVDPVGIVPYFLDRAGARQPVAQSFWHLKLRHWRLRGDAAYPTEPQPQHSQGANFDHKLALLGWDDPADGQITVYWRVLNTLQRDYQVSVGVEDAAGKRLGYWDGRPASYDYPAPRWRPGQVLFGRYPLALPAAAPAGDYTVTLTVYDATDPAGLDIRDEADNPAGKQVRLGPIRLGGGE